MSLNIYTSKDKIPSDIEYIRINDEFFNKYTHLSNDDLCVRILKDFEKAEYCSEDTFIGMNKEAGAIDRSYLSTKVKTVLNVINHPDKCFDLCECSNCWLESFILSLTEGHVLWKNLYHIQFMGKNYSCDVNFNSIHFTDIVKLFNFLKILARGDYDENGTFDVIDYYMDGDKAFVIKKYDYSEIEKECSIDELFEV